MNKSVIANANFIRVHLHEWESMSEVVVKGRHSKREVVEVREEEEEEDVDNIGSDDY